MVRFLEFIGGGVEDLIVQMGKILLLLVQAIQWLAVPPVRWRQIFKQMEFVGVKSVLVVLLTGAFTGMVLALQSYIGFKKFNAENMVGAIVGLSMTRELGPVLTGIMVTARAGSAMAAELGTMRVTEQIDALYALATNPVRYLIVPRLVAGVLMLPILTVISDFIGVVGGYFVGVILLGINSVTYMQNTTTYVEMSDLVNGLIKSAFFGLILALIGCYKGFNTEGGAEGVGRATTGAVVLSAILIIISDYFLTALMF
ncbi:MAG: ABC transporter permease [Candidatus Tectomicrobia bacterium]|uniref:ABC transporter permease n=1 Tax=Tectimicrobiota bacterium TaxID=2528274 RepID=A0A932GMX1_UNCTE|nr:ABC transporter permease [Candidatus Tectomicrobia bacterium]